MMGGIESPSGWTRGERGAWEKLLIQGGQGNMNDQQEGEDGQVWKCSWLGGRKHWFQSPRLGFQCQPSPLGALSL